MYSKSSKKNFVLLSASCALISFPMPVLAQAEQPEAAQENAQPTGGDIIVTARKRTERLIDVPVAVTALSAADLDKNAASDFAKVAEMAPQVSISKVGSGTGAVFTIRGISSSPSDAGLDQSVSVNLDGLALARGRIVGASLFDLQQVEILKGPQALFFGKNSPAGVISLTSAQPTSKFSGYLRAGYEFVADQKIAEGAVSGPISDTLKARLAIRYSEQLGWRRNTAVAQTVNPFTPFFDPVFPTPSAPFKRMPGGNDLVGRAIVKWEPVDNFTTTATIQGARSVGQGEDVLQEKACGTGLGLTNISSLGNGLGQGGRFTDPNTECKLDRSGYYGAVHPDIAKGMYHDGTGGIPYGLMKTVLGTVKMDYSTGPIDITGVTGYYWLNGWGTSSPSGVNAGTIYTFGGEQSRGFSQEVRVNSSFEGPINFMVGGYYEDSKRLSRGSTYLGYIGRDAATGNLFWYKRISDNTNDVLSAFGQMRWNILTNLELAGGARYTRDRKTTHLGHAYLHPALVGIFRTQGDYLDGDRKDENVSPEATLTWHPTNNQTLWGAFKSGWKAGGFSSPASLRQSFTFADIRFKPEKATGFEVGYKGKLLDNTLRFEINAYTYKYSQLQTSSFDGQLVVFFLRNAASARVKGLEALAEWHPIPPFTLRGNVGYNDASYLSYPDAACYAGQTAAQGCVGGRQDLGGTDLPRSPRWSGNIDASYDAALGGDMVLSLNGTAFYSSKYVTQESNPYYFYQPSFWRLNAGVRLHPENNDWELALIGRNLTNEYYTVFSGDKAFGRPGEINATLARPREVMVQATYRF